MNHLREPATGNDILENAETEDDLKCNLTRLSRSGFGMFYMNEVN